jgi:hypothetical protein
MQLLAILLLAESDNTAKPIFIALVIAIWIIGSIVSSIRKGTGSKKVQEERARLLATRQAMRLPAVAQSHPKWQPPKVAVKKSSKRRPPPIPPKAPLPPVQEPEPIMMQVVESAGQERRARQASGRPAPTRAATATALHQWLSPQTMRHQFILTELLQPPLALREERIV